MQSVNDVRNSARDPGNGDNGRVDGTNNSYEEDSEDGDEGDFDEESIATYLNTLHDMIIARHDTPSAGRIPGPKYGETLFEHQKHAVGVSMHSFAGSCEPGDGPSLIVTPVMLSPVDGRD
ncbi:CHD3-type chromatin-remodeling factor PICKLE [Fusarium sp. NRRL 52700]|nr:CHD3-type chromatin-remodeling factor PICKLE [Fusarium sp. NRRL 52700]